MKILSNISEILKYFGLNPHIIKSLTQGELQYIIKRYYLEKSLSK